MNDDMRQPHAVLNIPTRRLKGMKIERLLDLGTRCATIRMLEIGTGSGGIAQYFGTHPRLSCQVDAVDVRDSRLVQDGYQFQVVDGTRVPYPDASFDVVLTNHVIEHVGDVAAQRSHLAEVRRVLKSDGVGYLAVPNRWMLVEPHYRLAFLSWLPHSWRTPYLRAMRRGEIYDCEPLQMPELEALLRDAGFDFQNVCIPALRLTFDIERPHSVVAKLLRGMPDAALAPFRRLIPTLIYVLRPSPSVGRRAGTPIAPAVR